jgi:uroporphyrinogen decarboxylase
LGQSARERVTRCLTFTHPDRIPREMWLLPWTRDRYPSQISDILESYPSDFDDAPNVYRPSPRVRGNLFGVGEYVDEWGCRISNIEAGLEGEVRNPTLSDIREWRSVRPPYETLPEDLSAARDVVNRHCASTAAYVRTSDYNWGRACPTPWERWQYLRGAQNALMDIMDVDADVRGLLKLIHDFYLFELEFWVSTDVDAVRLGDDWGSQTQLLIPPTVWRELFKPLYRDYCDLAHSHGKSVFFHSDGHITEIYDDLIEIGVDALNSQLFCMDLQDLARRAKGRITFWGEIDRQHVLPSTDPQVGRDAVREVARHLYEPAGGIIAQLSLGPGGNPAVAKAVFAEWEVVGRETPSTERSS